MFQYAGIADLSIPNFASSARAPTEMLLPAGSAITTLLLPLRMVQPRASRLEAAVCLSDDLLFCQSDESSLSDLSKSRSLNEAEHLEACDASERRFSHAPPEGEGARAVVDFDRYSFPGDGYQGTDATPPAPFGDGDLARVSRTPLLTASECMALVAEADCQDDAWCSGSRTAQYAARAGSSISVAQLPTALRLVNERLLPALLPAIGIAFPTAFRDVSSLRLQEARLVKYNASAGQTELGMHRDGPVVTASVALNSPDEYGGGGTLIEALDRAGRGTGAGGAAHPSAAFRPGRGCAVLHPGNVRHGGAPISSGVRYILVCFFFDRRTVDHDRLCLLRANALLKRALKANKGSSYAADLLDAAAREFGNSLRCGNAVKAESALVGLGHALLELGDFAAAARALEAALQRAPCNAHALASLSAARVALGDGDGARRASLAACLADPRSATAHNTLGVLLLDAPGRDVPKARSAFARGLALSPNDPELLVNCGACAAEIGDLGAASALFAAALDARPAHSRAKDGLAACQSALYMGATNVTIRL